MPSGCLQTMRIPQMGCGLAADSDSVHKADNSLRSPTMRLRSLWYPYPSLHILSLFSAACSCCRTYSHWTVWMDWTGCCHACCPPRGRGVYSPVCILQYRMEQTRYYCEFVFCVLKHSYLSAMIAELTTGSNTPPTDSTNLWVTTCWTQHKSGTALIWCDSCSLY